MEHRPPASPYPHNHRIDDHCMIIPACAPQHHHNPFLSRPRTSHLSLLIPHPENIEHYSSAHVLWSRRNQLYRH